MTEYYCAQVLRWLAPSLPNTFFLGKETQAHRVRGNPCRNRTEGHDDRSQFGTAHGYRAFVGFLADGSRAVVVLANTKANVQDIGRHLLVDGPLPE